MAEIKELIQPAADDTAPAAAKAKKSVKRKAGRKAARVVTEKKSRPKKYLPTDRITFTRQLDLLRAWGVASLPDGKPVTNRDVAAIVKMQESTTSIANAFFTENGLLSKGDSGFTPCAEVLSFARAHDWDADTASQKLAPRIGAAWFALLIMPRLRFAAMGLKEAIEVIALEIGAGPEARGQVVLLLDYLEAAGLIEKDGNQIKAARGTTNTVPTATASPQSDKPLASPTPGSGGDIGRPVVATTFSTETPDVVQFQIAIRVNMAELSKWDPARLTAFFGGIASVLAAKGRIEEKATEDK